MFNHEKRIKELEEALNLQIAWNTIQEDFNVELMKKVKALIDTHPNKQMINAELKK